MVKDALELLLPDKMITHDSPSTLQVTMNHQAKEDRDVLHLLHYITEKRSEDIYTIEDVIPLMQTKFRIYVGDRMIKTVTNVIRGEELVCTRDGEYIEFTVPVINGHEMITIQ